MVKSHLRKIFNPRTIASLLLFIISTQLVFDLSQSLRRGCFLLALSLAYLELGIGELGIKFLGKVAGRVLIFWLVLSLERYNPTHLVGLGIIQIGILSALFTLLEILPKEAYTKSCVLFFLLLTFQEDPIFSTLIAFLSLFLEKILQVEYSSG